MNSKKIVDVLEKGNVLRLFLSDKDVNPKGDDWDDVPYDCNAGVVFEGYYDSFLDVFVPFEYAVIKECESYAAMVGSNSRFCKNDFFKYGIPYMIISQTAEGYNNLYCPYEVSQCAFAELSKTKTPYITAYSNICAYNDGIEETPIKYFDKCIPVYLGDSVDYLIKMLDEAGFHYEFKKI